MRGSEAPLLPRWARIAALVVLALFLAVWAWWPMLAQYPGTAIEDGRYFHHQIAIGKAAVLRYHEVPLWNAFDCRGIPMWDHPENLTASPIFWLTLPLSTTVTIIVWNLLHVAAGFVGMWLLARMEFKLSRMAAFVAAAFWAFGAGHTSQYAGEHEALISFLDAPILLLLWRRAETSWSAAVGCGLALGWMVYDGATYPLPFTVVMLGLETLLRVWPPKRGLRVAGAAAVVGLVAFTVGASRLLPLMDQFAAHKRVMEDDVDGLLDWQLLRDMYTLRTPHWRSRFHPHQYVFGEYISYVGWLGVALALLGMAASAAETGWLIGLSALVVLLMLGHFSPYAPWTWLHAHVFPFKSMRVSARFRLLLMVPISLWIAFATERVPEIVRKFSPSWGNAARAVVVGCALLAAGDVVGLGQEILVYRFADPPEKPVTPSPRFYYGGPGLAGDTIDEPRQNRAYLGCRAAWVYNADAALWEGDVPQARAPANHAVIESVVRTHNSFSLDVDAKEPTRILLNSAYDRGWQSTIGTVVDQGHLLALDVPSGKFHITVKYWPAKLTLGMCLSAIGLLGSLLFLFRHKIRKWRRGSGKPALKAEEA